MPTRYNIEKDSRAYMLSHEAHKLIQRMARKKHLTTAGFLELATQELAREYLTEEERGEVRAEAEAVAAGHRAPG